MAKIETRDVARLIGGGWKSYPVILIYGSDEGGVRETAERIIASAAGPDPDPLNHIQLDGDTLAADPPRLADEMNAFGMFGGMRIVHVRGAGKAPLATVEAAASEPADGALLILEAGELKKESALVKLATRHRNIAAAAIYADAGREIGTLIDNMLDEHGLKMGRDARALLSGALGADRALSRGELEKLALYARGQPEITPEMVTDIVADAGRHEAGTLVDHAFAGDLAFIEPEANRVFAGSANPSGVLTIAIGHAFFLRRALRGGLNEAGHGRSIHFSRKAIIDRSLPRWTETRLDRALAILDDAMLQSRTAARIAPEITIRALWAIARLA